MRGRLQQCVGAVVTGALAAVLLGGCGIFFPGQSEVTLRGELTPRVGTAAPGTLRLALSWTPSWGAPPERGPAKTVLTQGDGTTYAGPLPQAFSFALPARPPPGALVDLAP